MKYKDKQNNRQDNSDLSINMLPESNVLPGEIVIGTIENVDSCGQPWVDYLNNTEKNPILAMSTLSISVQHKGHQVALLFSNGDINKPVIMGLIHNPLYDIIDDFEKSKFITDENISSRNSASNYETIVDGNRIVLEGKEQIVLKCGDASITLTKAGKIVIRGKYLLNRSSGVNRIMGGAVQIN